MLKKLLSLALFLMFTQAAQAQTEQGQTENNSEQPKALVVYFSHSGNTEAVAKQIQEMLGADIFEIKTVRQYSSDYNTVIKEAREERDSNARPELASAPKGLTDGYDLIILGYPNWWGTMPMSLFTFLETYDFSGKSIAPFCTHGGSRLGSSERDIAALCPKATLLPGLALPGSQVKNAQSEIKAWLDGLKTANR